MRAATTLGINPTRLAILTWVARHPGATLPEMAEGLHVKRTTIRWQVESLANDKLLLTEGIVWGRPTAYTLNAELVREQLSEVEKLLLPASPGDQNT